MKAFQASTKRLSVAMLLVVAQTTLAGAGPADSDSPPPIAKAAAMAAGAADSESSNTACYFNNNGSITWQWGLKSDNGWYSFTGQWITTAYTKVEKFSTTTTTYDSIYQSCVNSQKYYKVGGQLFAIFAATSGVGNNYPILVGGGDLFPNY